MDPIILVQRQFESTINTMHLSNDLSNSVTRCLDEAATLMARNDWAKTSSLLDTSARYSSDSIRMLENAHSDLTRLSGEVLPLEAVDNVTFSDILKGLDRMIAQLRDTESKISHTISRVDEARSRFPRMAFINTMPLKILSDVFELLILSGFSLFSTEDIDREDSTGKLKSQDQIAILALVCSRWHWVITNSPILWSYVNLIVPGFHRQPFYSHALRRSSDAPMSIRIHQTVPSKYQQNHHLATWLAAVARRIYSLEICEDYATRELTNVIVSCWLQHGVPGTMKELSISCPKSRRHKFIQSTRSTPQSWRVNLSPAQLDAFLQPIFLLRLAGVFARWDSHAYQGLTHLRLDGGSIKEKDLINVLTRNPRLRCFYFNLRIWDRKLRKAPPTPVKLPDLEVLDLDTMDNTDLWSLLRLLVPGSVPLGIGLAITDLDYPHDFAETPEVQAFFQRSNITTCYFSAYGKFQVAWLPNILHRLADLRRLCLRNHSYLGGDSSMKPDGVKLCSQLSEVMMIDCKLDLDEFKDLLRVHNIQILRLWDCTVFRRGDKLDVGTKELNEELSELVADTKCYQGNDDVDSDPHMSWRFIKR